MSILLFIIILFYIINSVMVIMRFRYFVRIRTAANGFPERRDNNDFKKINKKKLVNFRLHDDVTFFIAIFFFCF